MPAGDASGSEISMGGWRRAAWGIVGLLIIAPAARAQFGPVSVYTEPVVRREVRPTVMLTGTAEARHASTLSAEFQGRVQRLPVDEGDYVAADGTVCELRRLPVELQLRQAEAQLASARAELDKQERGYRAEEVRQARARVASAEANLTRWEQEFERTGTLFEKGASTSAEMEQVEASYRQAQEALAEANANLDLLMSGFRMEDIQRARAQVGSAEAKVAELQDRLSNMTLAMPYDGYVVRKHCEVGEWLNPGTPVADVVDVSILRVRVDVPERYFGGIQAGAEAPVEFRALGDRVLTGRVEDVVPASNDATHTVPVRVDVENEMREGRPVIAAGLLARVWLPIGEPHEGLLVPKDAVIRQEGIDLVYTVSDERPAEAKPEKEPDTEKEKKEQAEIAAKTKLIERLAEEAGLPPAEMKFAVPIPIEIVQGYGAYMEVKSDRLEAGTPVITRGTYLMEVGTPVKIRPKEDPRGAVRSRRPEPGAEPAEAGGAE
jgi:multidrug efflux pump subunit AcrA (membrane-fusion protein)